MTTVETETTTETESLTNPSRTIIGGRATEIITIPNSSAARMVSPAWVIPGRTQIRYIPSIPSWTVGGSYGQNNYEMYVEVIEGTFRPDTYGVGAGTNYISDYRIAAELDLPSLGATRLPKGTLVTMGATFDAPNVTLQSLGQVTDRFPELDPNVEWHLAGLHDDVDFSDLDDSSGYRDGCRLLVSNRPIPGHSGFLITPEFCSETRVDGTLIGWFGIFAQEVPAGATIEERADIIEAITRYTVQSYRDFRADVPDKALEYARDNGWGDYGERTIELLNSVGLEGEYEAPSVTKIVSGRIMVEIAINGIWNTDREVDSDSFRDSIDITTNRNGELTMSYDSDYWDDAPDVSENHSYVEDYYEEDSYDD